MKVFNTAFPYFPNEDIEEILLEVREILEGNKMLTMGGNVAKFEEEFATYCATEYAVATNSCTAALEIALATLRLSATDEVVVPVQTFIATGSSVLKAGAKIVFCDVDDNFLLDFAFLKKVITKKTKAVIIVHFAGMISPDILEIKEYLKSKNIALIEDDAHAHGATFGPLKAGNIGDFGCFSFYSTKNMTTGEGGMITLNNKKDYDTCASLRNRGIDTTQKGELFINIGSNHRLTEIQGLLGRYQLKRLEEFVTHRNKIAHIYIEALSDLLKQKRVRIQQPAKNSRHAYWRFLLFLDEAYNRDAIQEKMNAKGIKVDAPYSPLLHKQPLFNSKLIFPHAEKLSKSHISLPIHMLITEDDAHFIVDTLKSLLND